MAQLAKAGDSVIIGINAGTLGAYSGFIQRSAPSKNATCPTVVPLNGLTRVAKHTSNGGYAVSGTVTDLTSGKSVTLLNNGGDAITVAADGSFTFPNTLTIGAAYAVTVGTQPSGKTCTVSNGSGTSTTNVSNVVVSCNGPVLYFVSTLAGTSDVLGSADGAGVTASFYFPSGVAVDGSGNVYVADLYDNKIRKVTPAGIVSTLAGTGAVGSTDGAGVTATFSSPSGVAVDKSGNVYVADTNNHKIRKITPAGIVSTLAGTGAVGSTDAIGAARFNFPSGIAVGANDNVYVSDTGNHVIRLIRNIEGQALVVTIAGSTSPRWEDGAGSYASFNYPMGIAVDAGGNVYVGDKNNRKIRKITPAHVVSTIAGTYQDGSADGAGVTATFSFPSGVAVDTSGNVYVADTNNHKIRKLAPQ